MAKIQMKTPLVEMDGDEMDDEMYDEMLCILDQNLMSNYSEPEGEGRRYGAGGKACYYCPHCHGSADWCPWMD